MPKCLCAVLRVTLLRTDEVSTKACSVKSNFFSTCQSSLLLFLLRFFNACLPYLEPHRNITATLNEGHIQRISVTSHQHWRPLERRALPAPTPASSDIHCGVPLMQAQPGPVSASSLIQFPIIYGLSVSCFLQQNIVFSLPLKIAS